MRDQLNLFQSTLPLRGATTMLQTKRHPSAYFNPHSPCGERRRQLAESLGHGDFNPHSPCGERHDVSPMCIGVSVFQSTLPLRGATPADKSTWYLTRFQSTLPLRGATDVAIATETVERISIHTPLAGSDLGGLKRLIGRFDFNPHSPCGERRGM